MVARRARQRHAALGEPPLVAGRKNAALTLESERIGYPGAPAALEAVRLSVRAGEKVALLGANGAGKTALLKSVVGLLPLGRGEVWINGRNVTGSPERAVAAGAGLVFQNPDDQLFGATVWDDVLFGPQNQGHSLEESTRRVAGVLAELGIQELAERPIDALSFGEKKRASLAGVLAMQPSLLLLDEPTAGLDPVGELAFLSLLERCSGEGRAALLFATHAVDLVPLFAERVILLAGHRVVLDGTPREVFRERALLEAARVRAPWAAELWLQVSSAAPPSGAPCLPLTLSEAAARLVPR